MGDERDRVQAAQLDGCYNIEAELRIAGNGFFWITIKKSSLMFDLIKRIPRCSASGLIMIKIHFDTSQLCCGVVHCLNMSRLFRIADMSRLSIGNLVFV